MNPNIAILLIQDGVTSGAIYALIALALLIVFTITRIILVPQGQFVTFSALSFGMLQAGLMPLTAVLVAALAVLAAMMDVVQAPAGGRLRAVRTSAWRDLAWPAGLLLVTFALDPARLNPAGQILLTLALVIPLGPLMYRLVFAPMADASVLLLLIVAVAVDVAMGGIALLLFGSDGMRTPPLLHLALPLGPIRVNGSTLLVVAVAAAAMLGLFLFFGRSLTGKALRATAYNALGARLVGIRVQRAGRLAFGLAAALGAVSGILVSSIMTVYFDSGFLIGLKGFIAAIIGGLVSYPLAVGGALVIGMIESWSAFYNSAFQEVIVFAALLPILVVRSLLSRDLAEEETPE
jgi:branched-chain amino acid transport system permease protein